MSINTETVYGYDSLEFRSASSPTASKLFTDMMRSNASAFGLDQSSIENLLRTPEAFEASISS